MKAEWLPSAMLGFWFGALFTVLFFLATGMHHSNQEIVDHQAAHYDTTTGEFTWNFPERGK